MMTSTIKLAVFLVTAVFMVVPVAGPAQAGPVKAVARHDGLAGCIRWWWFDSSTSMTTIQWQNLCPSRQNLVVSWRNDRTNTTFDDVLYEIPAGTAGSDTGEGVPVGFRQG